MDTVTFLEQLASHVHYRTEVKRLFVDQSDTIKKIFLENDVNGLKKQISDEEYFADRTLVVQGS